MLKQNKINRNKNETYKLMNKKESKLEKLFKDYKHSNYKFKEVDWGKVEGKEFW